MATNLYELVDDIDEYAKGTGYSVREEEPKKEGELMKEFTNRFGPEAYEKLVG